MKAVARVTLLREQSPALQCTTIYKEKYKEKYEEKYREIYKEKYKEKYKENYKEKYMENTKRITWRNTRRNIKRNTRRNENCACDTPMGIITRADSVMHHETQDVKEKI